MHAHDPNCIFCKIIDGQIPSRKVYEDDEVLAFHDIAPWAPVHVLIIPKAHIASMAQLRPEDAPLMGKIMTLGAAAGAEGRWRGLSGWRFSGDRQHRRAWWPRGASPACARAGRATSLVTRRYSFTGMICAD